MELAQKLLVKLKKLLIGLIQKKSLDFKVEQELIGGASIDKQNSNYRRGILQIIRM